MSDWGSETDCWVILWQNRPAPSSRLITVTCRWQFLPQSVLRPPRSNMCSWVGRGSLIILQTKLGFSRWFRCSVRMRAESEHDAADFCIFSGAACSLVNKRLKGFLFVACRKAISRSGLHYLGPPQPTLPPASNGPNKELRACVDWTVSLTPILNRLLFTFVFLICVFVC